MKKLSSFNGLKSAQRRCVGFLHFGMVPALMLVLLFGSQAQAQVNAYTFAASAGTYTPIAGTVVHTNPWDDAVTSVPIGFSFTFNNVAFSSVAISTNGFVTFGSTLPGNTLSTPISASAGMPE